MGKNENHRGRKHVDADQTPSQPKEKTRNTETETLHSQVGQKRAATGPSHDPAEIRAHDDAGHDRLFEGRQQHDDAEKSSEKTRLARDIDKHKHSAEGPAAPAGRAGAKRSK